METEHLSWSTLLRTYAQTIGEKPFLHRLNEFGQPEIQLTFSDVYEHSSLLVTKLLSSKVSPGDKVLVFFANPRELILGVSACLAHGAIAGLIFFINHFSHIYQSHGRSTIQVFSPRKSLRNALQHLHRRVKPRNFRANLTSPSLKSMSLYRRTSLYLITMCAQLPPISLHSASTNPPLSP